MRTNVYHEELTNEVQIAHTEPAPGRRYIGLRFMLKSADALHNRADDDDRSAVTFWVGDVQRGRKLLLTALDALDRDESDQRPASYPSGEFDAFKWADEFQRIFGKQMPGGPNYDTLVGWFANAIMTGYDKAKNEATKFSVEAVPAEFSETSASAPPSLQRCPICDSTPMVRLAENWQENPSGTALPIIGCGNPWHYAVPEARSLGDTPEPVNSTAEEPMNEAEPEPYVVSEIGRRVGNAQVTISTHPTGVNVEIRERS